MNTGGVCEARERDGGGKTGRVITTCRAESGRPSFSLFSLIVQVVFI